GWAYVLLRSPVPSVLIDPLRRAVSDLDPDLPIEYVRTVDGMIADSQHNLRLAGQTLIAFAGFGLLLAAIGIYGVISSLVAQRTTEFGIRLALGATPRGVQGLVVRDGMVLTTVGILLGIAGAVT